ncbi:hypothetical protein [Photobacterium sp. GJ3]|nr:hypothetical protein [Photobacterium sp. GJ3]
MVESVTLPFGFRVAEPWLKFDSVVRLFSWFGVNGSNYGAIS